MRGKSKAHRWLWRLFWLSVLGVTGYLWYYMDRAVPDRVSILENEEASEGYDFQREQGGFTGRGEQYPRGSDHDKQKRAVFYVCRGTGKLSGGA